MVKKWVFVGREDRNKCYIDNSKKSTKDESQSGEDKKSHQRGYSCVLLGFSIGGPTDDLHSFIKCVETGLGLEMTSTALLCGIICILLQQDQTLEVKVDFNAILVETKLKVLLDPLNDDQGSF